MLRKAVSAVLDKIEDKIDDISASMWGIWTLLGIPTFLFWIENIPWLVFMSWYAIVATHFTGWIAARADRRAKEAANGG